MNRTSTRRRRTTLLAMEQLPSRTLLSGIEVVPASPFTGPAATKPGFPAPQGSFRPLDTSLDLAFQGNGYARPAVAKDVIPGYANIHQPQYANDGAYGNGASWIGNSPGSWLKIDLGRVTSIESVVIGRDRLGSYDDRDPGQFTVDVAVTDNVYANGDSSNDAAEYTRVFDSSLSGFSGSILGPQSLRAVLATAASARYVKLTFVNQGAAIDEVEVQPATAVTPAPVTAVQFTGLVHIQDLGDQPLQSGSWAGTKGQSRRLEGIQLSIPAAVQARLGVQMMMHQQNSGDSPWVDATTFLGSRGASLRIEGLAFRLTGPDAAKYDVDYKVHLEGIGDTGVSANGQFAGTRGQGRRLEAVIISIVPKGTDPFPVDPSAPRDLRGKWAGPLEGLLRDDTPSTFRYKVQTNRFVYDPVNDRVDFSVEMVWTKKIKVLGTTITVFKISCTAEGFVNLRNPTTLTFRVGKGDVRFDIPLVGSFDTYKVHQSIAGWFAKNAAAIRSS